MCWVMPPASAPAVTSVRRAAASSRLGLAVVDVAHDSDDGRAGQHVGVDILFAVDPEFDVAFADPADAVAEFLDDEFGGVGVERLGRGGHDAHFHQALDDLRHTGGHAVGEFLDGDGLGQHDVAHDLHLIAAEHFQLGLAALALALATDGGEAAAFLVLALDGGLDVDAAGAAAVAGLFDDGENGLAAGSDDAGAAARGFLFLAGAGRLEAEDLVGRAGRGRAGGSRARRVSSPAPKPGLARQRLERRPTRAGLPPLLLLLRPWLRPSRVRRLLRPGGPLPRRRGALPPRGGALPRRRREWKSSPARGARLPASRLRAAARPARADVRRPRSRSGRAAGRRGRAAGAERRERQDCSQVAGRPMSRGPRRANASCALRPGRPWCGRG